MKMNLLVFSLIAMLALIGCGEKIDQTTLAKANMTKQDYSAWHKSANRSYAKSDNLTRDADGAITIQAKCRADHAEYFVQHTGEYMLDCLKYANKKSLLKGENVTFCFDRQWLGVDKFGNESLQTTERLFAVCYKGDDLTKINWKNIDKWKILNLPDNVICYSGDGAEIFDKHIKGKMAEFTQKFNQNAFLAVLMFQASE